MLRERERSRDRVLKETLLRDDHYLLSNTNSGTQYANICTVMPRYMIKLTVISAEGVCERESISDT